MQTEKFLTFWALTNADGKISHLLGAHKCRRKNFSPCRRSQMQRRAYFSPSGRSQMQTDIFLTCWALTNADPGHIFHLSGAHQCRDGHIRYSSPFGRTGLGWWAGRGFDIGPVTHTTASFSSSPPLFLRGECLRLLHKERPWQGGERSPLGRWIVGRAHGGSGQRSDAASCWGTRLTEKVIDIQLPLWQLDLDRDPQKINADPQPCMTVTDPSRLGSDPDPNLHLDSDPDAIISFGSHKNST